MIDFTVKKYEELLQELIRHDYVFQTFAEYLGKPAKKSIILRHDVDKRPGNSLVFAKIENSLGLNGSYYFRAVPQSWDEKIIREIADLGHEIGYHYEDMVPAKGNPEIAIKSFESNLGNLRKLAPVSTICMHGSPRSRHDSKDLWKTIDYRDFQLTGEPYFDMDFSRVLYLSDTGRRWDGNRVSIRDKVDPRQTNVLVDKGFLTHSTNDVISAARSGVLPDHIMFTLHPQRWNNKGLYWFEELIFQNTKNIIKGMIITRIKQF